MFEDKCPVCGNVDWDIDGTDIEGDLRINRCRCEECESTWNEKWSFLCNDDIVIKTEHLR